MILRCSTALAISVLICACAATKKPEISPQEMASFNLRVKEADAAYTSASYQGLKKAWDLYQELQSFPAYKEKTAEKFIRTSLLLALRERELAIYNPATLAAASETIAAFPRLNSYSEIAESVEGIPHKTKGVTGEQFTDDTSLDNYMEWTKVRVPILKDILKDKAETGDLFAYIYTAFHSYYFYKFPKEEENVLRFQVLFPDSPLLAFRFAIFPMPDREKLETILTQSPDFHEVHIFLGDLQLEQGNVLSAEKEFLQAVEHLPRSTSLAISLSKVYFHMEEFETCLEYNQKALDLAPFYRDALLGKAMCLGYMGRHEEALPELERMLELGKYYIGETYYWLAWNLKELERYEEAAPHIEAAKRYLIGHHEVMSLSGIIAYHLGELQEAEAFLKEALNLVPVDCETYFYLGQVYADTSRWKESGEYFEQAAGCDQRTENALEAKIREIENADLSAARKAKLIRQKRLQIRQTLSSKATALYNGAAGYFNAGMYDMALGLAQLSATHPALKAKADDLVLAIKEKRK
jgi:tetratricopeptide (TPR) repeat protein